MASRKTPPVGSTWQGARGGRSSLRTPTTPTTPATTPTNPLTSTGRRAAHVLQLTPTPLSRPPSGSTPPSSPIIPVSIGHSQARASRQTLWQTLFEGTPPLVERKTAPGGGVRFKFNLDTPLEQLRQPIEAACHELFAPTRPLGDAVAFLDAVCRQPGDAQVWQDMLRAHGEALSQSPGLLPTDVLTWVQRLWQTAQADPGGINGPGGRAALRWAQSLVQGYSPGVSGAAAKACALVNQWARELGSGTHTGPTLPHTPPLTPRDDSPVGRALQSAELGGSVQPLIDALREWPGERPGERPGEWQDDADAANAADDIEADGRRILRRVLTLCATRELDRAQRADLLRAAHPLLGSAWTCDALLRSDYATAVHRWLESDEAAHLLLANGQSAEQAPAVPLRRSLNKTFAPWLMVSLTVDPVNALITDVECVARAEPADKAPPVARQRARQNLVLWLEAELRDPNGLSWPLLTKLLEAVHVQLGNDMALPSTQWLKMAIMQFQRSGDIEPTLLLLPSLSIQQRRMESEGHRQPLLDDTLLDKVFLVARQPALDLVSRGNLIQNTLPLLPKERNGPGAASHAACLLAILALDDLLMRANLFDAYREKFPFAGLSDLSPRLFILAGQLNADERLRSKSTWSAFANLPSPGNNTAWPVWRALCRELGRRMVPRILEVQRSTPPTPEQHPFNEQILRTLTRLSQNRYQPGLAAERLAELLADLTEALPAEHRHAFLVQLEAASRAAIERFLKPETGARPAPVPPRQIALLGALRALIDQIGDDTPQTPVAGASPAFNTATQFFREWFAARLAGRLSDRPYQGSDLKTLKLLHEIDTYSPRRLLRPAQVDPVEALIEDLFALHKLA